MDVNNIGMITEQGDLGLGFNKLSEKDAQTLKETAEKEKKTPNGVYKESDGDD